MPLFVWHRAVTEAVSWHYWLGLLLTWLVAFVHCLCCNWQVKRSLWDAGAVQPGVFVPAGARASHIGERLRALHASLRLTRWAWNGDMQTLVPYILYAAPRVAYTRLWFKAPAVGDRGDGSPPTSKPQRSARGTHEVLAHDWAFPPTGHDPSQPLALVLHGLNGGSAEPLVQDFVAAATASGWTCVVLNARGLGGTELTSAQPFHGARTSDLGALVALVAEAAPGVRLVGVGYSMGAIILANYLGVAGPTCALAAAVAVSGCMDAVANKGGYSARTLEPFLTYELKQNFCTGARGALLANAGVDVAAAVGPRVGCIMEFDAATVVPANGFTDVDDYYRHMSVGHLGKLHRVGAPLLHLHACDDPIIDCDTFAPFLPRAAVGAPCAPPPPLPPNLYALITRRGGHVGWCEGWWPWRARWSFQNRAVLEFVHAVLTAPEHEPEPPREAPTARAPRATGASSSTPSRKRPARSPGRSPRLG